MTTLAVTSVNSLLCQASTCFRIGSKLRCIRSTPTEMQSMSENDFECFASTGVKTPVLFKTIFPEPSRNGSLSRLNCQRDDNDCLPHQKPSARRASRQRIVGFVNQ